MRTGIEGIAPVVQAVSATFSFLFSIATPLCGQMVPPELSFLAEQFSEDGLPYADVVDYYEDLAARRPNINRLSRAELEKSSLLTVFQIVSLMDHRQRYGDVLSEGELSLVDGFSPADARKCAVFFSFSDSFRQDGKSGFRHQISAKATHKFAGEGLSFTGKYKCTGPLHWSFGLTADNDAGEKLPGFPRPDFISAFVQYRGEGVLKNIVAGDFSLRSGQGLVLCKSSSISSPGTPASLMKSPSGVTPYSSAGESSFFRGGALGFATASCSLTLFASYAPVDARVVGDSLYTSISDDGYHRVPSEISVRHAMHETVVGTASSLERGRWRFGFSAVAYSYDKKNGRREALYNKYQLYDGWWGNAGADFFYHKASFRLFGEFAFDAGGAFAAVAGLLWNPCYEAELSLLLRHYGKDYIATHAGAYSTLSSCSNQDGAAFASRFYLSKRLSLLANADFSYYPWVRYATDGPTSSFKSRVEVRHRIGELSSLSLQYRYNRSYKGSSHLVRGDVSLFLSRNFSLDCKVAANTGGWAACAGFSLSFFKRRMELSGRFTAFDTDGYDNRIYFYEGNVPQTYSVRPLYGRGCRGYLMFRYTPAKWLSVWLRISDEGCAYFTRSFIPG